MLIRIPLELEDSPFSAEDQALVDARLAEHHDDPDSSVPLEELNNLLQTP